jgi:ionotropic glutamate receptor
MASSVSALLRVLCLCSVLPLALPARPANVSIGALFTFDSVIGRSARAAIDLAVADVNRDAAVLNGTRLSVVEQDTKCSGFVGTIQGTVLPPFFCCSSSYYLTNCGYSYTINNLSFV